MKVEAPRDGEVEREEEGEIRSGEAACACRPSDVGELRGLA